MKMEKNFTQKKSLRVRFNYVFLFIAFFTTALNANAKHGQVADQVAVFQQKNLFQTEFNLFSINNSSLEKVSQIVTSSTLLNLNSTVAGIVKNKPDYIKLKVPYKNGSAEFILLLYKTNISPNGQTLITSDGRNYPVDEVVNYRGIIENDFSSLTAITITEKEVMGFISNNDGNYVLGKIEGNKDGLHILYNDRDLIPSSNIECSANTALPVNEANKYYAPAGTNTVKCVNWYWEFDYDIYVQKGNSVPNVNTFANGVFNQVSTLYANDGVSVGLQTIYVWTATDPYTGPTTSDYLNQFGVNRTSFVGDLANLIGNQGGGGVAWISGLCNSQTKYKMGYMGVSSSFNTVPTYSWTVEVVTHENGHLLSSRHTHDCVWNGNNTKIDGCGDSAGYPSGTCAIPSPALPVGGGTIMSYCHLTSAGINFNNGFGPQPSAQIVNYVNNSSCLSACSTCNPPSQPAAITGNASACPSTSQTYSVAAVSGATSYTWSLPSGWSGTSTTNSITATSGSAGGTISVVAVNSCGNSTARTLAVTTSSLPAQPGTITGNASTCPSVSQTYSVAIVSGATSYTWTLPSGWSGTSTTNSITVITTSTGGNVSVTANNNCGSSNARILAVSTASAPVQPGTISGSSSVCAGLTGVSYSVANVSGNTYNWTAPANATIVSGQGTNSITLNYSSTFTSGNLQVVANNSCGNSTARTLAITLNTSSGTTPGRPKSVTGNTDNLCGQTTSFTANPLVAGGIYNWTFPTGTTINSQSTNTVNVTFPASGMGNSSISVNVRLGCNTGLTRSIAIKGAPVSPSISGSATACANSSGNVYSVTARTGVSYSWSVPSGATITAGAGTNSITVHFGATTGQISCNEYNACGSSAGVKAITFNCRQSQAASTISNALNFNAYPNPANDILHWEYNTLQQGDASIQISDMTGKIISHESVSLNEGLNQHSIDISKFSKGIYVLTFSNAEGTLQSRIIIE